MKFERLSRRGAGAGGRIAKRPEVEAGVGERSEAESRFGLGQRRESRDWIDQIVSMYSCTRKS